MGRRAVILTLVSLMAGMALAQSDAAQAAGPPCQRLVYEGNAYAVCELDLEQQSLRLFWKQANGKPYGTLLNFAVRSMARQGRMLFAMNAGMYHPDRTPVGLYVENGRELVAADTSAGAGNFYLKPNGVFFVDGDVAGILETSRFLEKRLLPTLATQSGPMLVIDGDLHPRISRHGVSRNVRNGVGVRDPHRVVLAISLGRVTFGELARLFRDRLQCPNALYLDGKISGLYAPKTLHKNILTPVGPILGAFDRK